MTIWTFGDSFSKHFKPSKYFNYLEDSWVERTSKLLEQNIKSFSKPLLTLEHTYHMFNDVRDQFTKDDVIIITLTNTDRKWFWKKQPLKILYLDEPEIEALEHFNDCFYDRTEIYLTNFLYNVNSLIKEIGVHVIVISSFSDAEDILKPIKHNYELINFADVSLSDVSVAEFSSDFFDENSSEWLRNKDFRVNHICRDNHVILSDKIIDNIKYKTSIELTTGFKNKFIDKTLLVDPTFVNDQMFGGIMSRLQRIKINRP